MSDKALRRQQFAAVLIVAALAAVVSYSHIRDLAVTHGGDQLTSALLPLLIDGTVAVMSFAMVRAARSGDTRVPWLVRFMLVLFAGATLAANLDYGAGFGVTGALLWTLPAVAFVGSIEVMVLMVRRMQPAGPSARPSVAAVVKPPAAPKRKAARKPSDTARAARLRALLDAGQPVTIDRAMAELKAGRPVAKRALELAKANGNGEAH